MKTHDHVPGITPTSVLATLFGLLLTAILVQYSEIVLAIAFPAEYAVAIPAVCALLVVTLIAALARRVGRLQLLTRAEMLCLLFTLLIATPLMTQAFWHRVVSLVSTFPRLGDFEKLDVMNAKLWPHGRQLLPGGFGPESAARWTPRGRVAWEEIDVAADGRARLPVLSNADADAISSVRITLPVAQIVQGEPYLVSILTRAINLGPQAYAFCRVYDDASSRYTEFINSTAPPKITWGQRTGFRRMGAYGVKFSPAARQSVTLEFGLQGSGRLELWDPQLYSVVALEAIYKGRRVVTQSEWAGLEPGDRAFLVVKPDRLWSLDGLRFWLAGYIPIRDWIVPMVAWGAFLVLILGGMFAINIILRRQWMENERFQLPVARIPIALIDDGGGATASGPPIWKHRLMWGGLVVTLLWELLQAWHFYNPKVPNTDILVPLQPYFADPGWGAMWVNVRFEVVPIFLAIGIFMELNILMSLVVGYFLFRAQLWAGHMGNLDVDPAFPWTFQQGIGSYLGYALIILFFMRKYLWRVLKLAISGRPDGTGGAPEALSYRWALLLLLGVFAGTVVWSRALGMATAGILTFVLLLLAIGLVATRIRTECGTPWGYFVPGNLAAFMVVIGGIPLFGAESMIFCFMASFMVAPTVFFLIPGAQMELLEYGRRWQVRPRHLFWCGLAGVAGGLLIGGWVFLSNAYALGGETLPYGWAFDGKPAFFSAYNQEMIRATNEIPGGEAAARAGLDHGWVAFGLAGLVTMLLAALRQLFAGFWFHPVGFVLGGSNFAEYVWGSMLTAWLLRKLVLRFGGAVTVREKLQPLSIGIFLGVVLAYVVLAVHTAHLRAAGVDKIYTILMPL